MRVVIYPAIVADHLSFIGRSDRLTFRSHLADILQIRRFRKHVTVDYSLVVDFIEEVLDFLVA
jgi:hypothetical protein